MDEYGPNTLTEATSIIAVLRQRMEELQVADDQLREALKRMTHAFRNILEICKGELARAEPARPAKVYKDAFGREVIYEQLVHHGRVTGHADTQEELLRKETGEEPLGNMPDTRCPKCGDRINEHGDHLHLDKARECPASPDAFRDRTGKYDALIERLNRLAKRRDMEGIYTDGNICEEAATAIASEREEIVRLQSELIKCHDELEIEKKAHMELAASYHDLDEKTQI